MVASNELDLGLEFRIVLSSGFKVGQRVLFVLGDYLFDRRWRFFPFDFLSRFPEAFYFPGPF